MESSSSRPKRKTRAPSKFDEQPCKKSRDISPENHIDETVSDKQSPVLCGDQTPLDRVSHEAERDNPETDEVLAPDANDHLEDIAEDNEGGDQGNNGSGGRGRARGRGLRGGQETEPRRGRRLRQISRKIPVDEDATLEDEEEQGIGVCSYTCKEHVALDRSSWSMKSICNRLL